VLNFLKEGFQAAAMAKVGTSALESRKLGYLLDSDIVVPHKDELLFVAISQAKAMAAAGYRPPASPSRWPAAAAGHHQGHAGQHARRRLHQPHDFHIASLIADVVCGGDVDAGTLVTEEYLMALERKHFCGLLEHPKTQERIMGMLQTGKPVRN
jgi:3-hydroxyacyl-CoA dehydrogenase